MLYGTTKRMGLIHQLIEFGLFSKNRAHIETSETADDETYHRFATTVAYKRHLDFYLGDARG